MGLGLGDAFAARARGWHEVDAAGGEGVAAEEAPGGEGKAAGEAVGAECLGGVTGAGGVVAAAGVGAGEGVEERGDEELVEFYEDEKWRGEKRAQERTGDVIGTHEDNGHTRSIPQIFGFVSHPRE